jgi:iron transport multicopper oxidase
LTTAEDAANPEVYGQVNPYVLKHGEIVEIVINNLNTNLHPWHMHGHQFQLIDRPDPGWGKFNGTFRPGFPHKSPVLRDTIMVQDDSWAVIRFRADNPGVWPFHCHIELHVNSGFTATLIEAPDALQAQNLTIPEDHIAACQAYPMAYSGNAGGNTVQPLDLSGANTEVPLVGYGSMYPPGTPPSAKRAKL